MVLLDNLLLCLSSNQSEQIMEGDCRMAVAQAYIQEKVRQINTKLGLSLDEQVTKLGHNYALNYIRGLASERVITITKSLRHSLRLFVNLSLVDKQLTVNSQYVYITISCSMSY